MPQKLIRLTSDSGDGIFNGIFNQEINIKENSSIALQSLSVERKSQAIQLNNTSGEVNFSSVSGGSDDGITPPFSGNQIAEITPQQLYNKSNYLDLVANIGHAMNRVCSLYDNREQWGLQHLCSINKEGKIELNTRLSPFYQIQNPQLPDFLINDAGGNYASSPNGEILNMWKDYKEPPIIYRTLADGNPWVEVPGGGTKRFDVVGINAQSTIANYRQTTDGSAVFLWWRALDAINWEVYGGTLGPVAGSTPIALAVIPPAPNAEITFTTIIGGAVSTYTPAGSVGLLPWFPEYGMWRDNDSVVVGTNEPDLFESYVFGTEPCIKSTGIFRTRFKQLNSDGSNDPSFTMGLVKGADGLKKLNNATFTLADCVYAIRVRGTTATIQYQRQKTTDAASSWVDSGILPQNFNDDDWTDGLNDVLDISFADGKVNGIIYSDKDSTPVKTSLLGAIGHDDTADYYWFISMHENYERCVLDLTGVTLDPVFNLGLDDPTSVRPENVLPGIIDASEIVQVPEYTEFMIIDNEELTPSVLFNELLATYLGFDNAFLTNLKYFPVVEVQYKEGNGDRFGFDQVIGYKFTADNLFDNSYDSDTYIVDTQTFTLDSFDSFGLSALERTANSGGSRRNIIATIPITEVPIVGTANSLIQFQPATLNYVDVKNRGDMVTRQVRCRLLTGTYQPVKTEGLASLVLLIKE